MASMLCKKAFLLLVFICICSAKNKDLSANSKENSSNSEENSSSSEENSSNSEENLANRMENLINKRGLSQNSGKYSAASGEQSANNERNSTNSENDLANSRNLSANNGDQCGEKAKECKFHPDRLLSEFELNALNLDYICQIVFDSGICMGTCLPIALGQDPGSRGVFKTLQYICSNATKKNEAKANVQCVLVAVASNPLVLNNMGRCVSSNDTTDAMIILHSRNRDKIRVFCRIVKEMIGCISQGMSELCGVRAAASTLDTLNYGFRAAAEYIYPQCFLNTPSLIERLMGVRY